VKKVAVFLAEGFEEIEAVTVVDYLRRAKADVSLLAVPVGRCTIAGLCDDSLLVTGAHGIAIEADISLDSYCASLDGMLPDAVYCPGGMPGAANIGASVAAVDLIKDCAAAGRMIAAICAAPVVTLSRTGVLAGHKYTGYPGMEEGLSKYCDNCAKMQSLMKDSCLVRNVPFVTDGNLLTGRGPGTAEQFAMEFVRLLFGEAVADQIHESSVQR
jgi:protein deglycase